MHMAVVDVVVHLAAVVFVAALHTYRCIYTQIEYTRCKHMNTCGTHIMRPAMDRLSTA